MLLRSGLLAGVGGLAHALASCSAPDGRPITSPSPTATATSFGSTPTGGEMTGRMLLAYFSRPGENHYYAGRRDLDVGNTQLLTRMIAELIDCDIYRIEALEARPEGQPLRVVGGQSPRSSCRFPAAADPNGSARTCRQPT